MARHKRVYQVAKEHRISSEVLMGILPKLGIEVKNHLDKIEDEDLDRVSEWFEKYPDGEPPADSGERAVAEEIGRAHV